MLSWLYVVSESPDYPNASLAALTTDFFVRCVALSSPYVLYYLIWHNGMGWKSLCRNNGVEVFSTLCLFLKVVLYTLYCASFPGSWAFGIDVHALLAHATNLPPTAWIFFAAWMAVGQALNLGIYNAIGKVGVYYGFKMGHHVPWVTGFPFNVVSRHPQYIGSYCSFTALLPSLWTAAGFSNALPGLYAFVFICYVLVSKMEESDENPEEKDA
eukprot:CAMPEP_0181134862 /NCGR_PEP_ID=MMETSP1071-20121207/32315_1 /TAXON_ID=35127 /ORGANISM="Thalassiosira sp., Strain NH16" /LENGTH=212 /DNA_ID=CAMNT_0023221411 /DNA_START=78 /DNA_END=716 /DNA_ORIENTATION=+